MRLTRSRRAVLLLLLGGFIPLLIFGDLAEDVWKQGGFWFDVPLLLAIHRTAQPKLDVFVSHLTKLGVFWGVFPAAAMIVLFLLIRQRWRALEYFAIELIGQQAQRLNLDTVYFWDESVFDAEGSPAPIGDHDWMLERAQEMFDAMNPLLGGFFSMMVERHLLERAKPSWKGRRRILYKLPKL